MLHNILPILLISCLLAAPTWAKDRDEILNETLQQEHQRADENEAKVRELTRQAGEISTQLTDIEHDVALLQRKIRKQEAILTEIKDNEKQAQRDHFQLEEEKQRITLELSGLMKTLWPVHLQNVRSRFEGVDSWDMFDRRFNWLAEIYNATTRKLAEARANSEEIAANLDHQRSLAIEAEKQLAEVNKSKDRLLNNKYALRKNLKTIRTRRKRTPRPN